MTNPHEPSDPKLRLRIKVHVTLSDFLSRVAPESKLEVEMDAGSTVADLITLLADYLGQDFREAFVDREDRLHEGISIVLDKRLILQEQICEIVIEHGSNLSFIPLIGGG
jgi:hypothetical protein